MVQAQSEDDPNAAEITLTPDMRPVHSASGISPPDAAPKSFRLGGLLRFAGAICGVVALGTSIWVYADTRQEILRVSTELAQLRVSLDLYARNAGGSGAPADLSALTELTNRLAILEQNWRTGSATLPPVTPATTSPQAASGPEDQDCLPTGMRILVAAGDRYQVCGQPSAVVDVGSVFNGYITLADGTAVASGGTMPLPDNLACRVTVTSGGDEGLTGYAEIRVDC